MTMNREVVRLESAVDLADFVDHMMENAVLLCEEAKEPFDFLYHQVKDKKKFEKDMMAVCRANMSKVLIIPIAHGILHDISETNPEKYSDEAMRYRAFRKVVLGVEVLCALMNLLDERYVHKATPKAYADGARLADIQKQAKVMPLFPLPTLDFLERLEECRGDHLKDVPDDLSVALDMLKQAVENAAKRREGGE